MPRDLSRSPPPRRRRRRSPSPPRYHRGVRRACRDRSPSRGSRSPYRSSYRRKSPSPSPRRRISRSPSPRRHKSRSPSQRHYRRKRSRSVTSSPITKSQSPPVARGPAENKNIVDKQRLEEEKKRLF
uniref:Expressed protein n=1 Tax=Oryza sativa subsp. japonica TaxID=39947 RepID=H2KWE3_ORYSJ|nr:expressed protein [Oryza sativa Japonica Group]